MGVPGLTFYMDFEKDFLDFEIGDDVAEEFLLLYTLSATDYILTLSSAIEEAGDEKFLTSLEEHQQTTLKETLSKIVDVSVELELWELYDLTLPILKLFL